MALNARNILAAVTAIGGQADRAAQILAQQKQQELQQRQLFLSQQISERRLDLSEQDAALDSEKFDEQVRFHKATTKARLRGQDLRLQGAIARARGRGKNQADREASDSRKAFLKLFKIKSGVIARMNNSVLTFANKQLANSDWTQTEFSKYLGDNLQDQPNQDFEFEKWEQSHLSLSPAASFGAVRREGTEKDRKFGLAKEKLSNVTSQIEELTDQKERAKRAALGALVTQQLDQGQQPGVAPPAPAQLGRPAQQLPSGQANFGSPFASPSQIGRDPNARRTNTQTGRGKLPEGGRSFLNATIKNINELDDEIDKLTNQGIFLGQQLEDSAFGKRRRKKEPKKRLFGASEKEEKKGDGNAFFERFAKGLDDFNRGFQGR